MLFILGITSGVLEFVDQDSVVVLDSSAISHIILRSNIKSVKLTNGGEIKFKDLFYVCFVHFQNSFNFPKIKK